MDADALLELCHRVADLARGAGADEAEVAASWQRSVETHMENNDLHTVESLEETTFGLRVRVGSSTGFVTSNDVSEAVLAERAREAIEQARATPPDAYGALAPPQPIQPVAGLHDDALEQMGIEDTARLAAALLGRIHDTDERVRVDSGSVAATTSASALASTTGISVCERDTISHGYFFGMAVDGDEVASFDYDGDSVRCADELAAKLEAAADRFCRKCTGGLGAGNGTSYRGSILLAPEAVVEFLLPNLVGAMCADAVRKGRSRLANKLGARIADSCFTLTDDGTRAGGVASSAFDREGLPVRRLRLIEGGVLASFLGNHYEAVAADDPSLSTGHASGSVTSLPGVGPTFLEVDAGNMAERELLASTDRAVLVNRFSGSTDPVTGDFSGVVKNGFSVHRGELAPIKEVLIAGNLYELLNAISGMSRERRLLDGARLVPMMRIEGISVTAG